LAEDEPWSVEGRGPLTRTLNLMVIACGVLLGLVVLIVLFETLAGGSNTSPPPKRAAKHEEGKAEHRRYDAVAKVKGVVDGATIRIVPAIDGANGVRLIGADTPDAKGAKTGGQPYGERASRFTESALDGKKVGLDFDAERKDRHGRLLAYVYPVGGGMFNEDLLRKGYAQAYTVKPNDEHRGDFEAAQKKAEEDDLGIWGLPEGRRCELANHANGIGEDSPACRPRSNPAPKHEAKPKRKHPPATSNGSSVGPDLDCSDLTYKQAQAEMAADSSDPFNLDADGDGVACNSLIDKEATGSAAATVSVASSP
jgi:endonuclease YncB( thermonuclease family)